MYSCLFTYFQLQHLHIALHHLGVFLHALLECLENLLVLFGRRLEDVVLLLLHLLDHEEDLSRHIMNFLLLLHPLHDVRDLVADRLDRLRILEQCVDGLLIMAHLVLPLLQLFVARVVVSLLPQVFHLLLQNISTFLEVHYL